MKTVNELKRKINLRKKFTDCTFDDFKQEDKLELLVKVLSNEEVLQHLYHKIFSPKPKINFEELIQDEAQHQLMSERLMGRGDKEKGRS